MQTWVHTKLPSQASEASRTFLLGLFEQHVDAGLAWVRANGTEYLPSVDITLVTSLTSFLQVCWRLRHPDHFHIDRHF